MVLRQTLIFWSRFGSFTAHHMHQGFQPFPLAPQNIDRSAILRRAGQSTALTHIDLCGGHRLVAELPVLSECRQPNRPCRCRPWLADPELELVLRDASTFACPIEAIAQRVLADRRQSSPSSRRVLIGASSGRFLESRRSINTFSSPVMAMRICIFVLLWRSTSTPSLMLRRSSSRTSAGRWWSGKPGPSRLSVPGPQRRTPLQYVVLHVHVAAVLPVAVHACAWVRQVGVAFLRHQFQRCDSSDFSRFALTGASRRHCR